MWKWYFYFSIKLVWNQRVIITICTWRLSHELAHMPDIISCYFSNNIKIMKLTFSISNVPAVVQRSALYNFFTSVFFTVVCYIEYLPASKFRKGFRFLQIWIKCFVTCCIVYKLQRSSPPYTICYNSIRPIVCRHFPASRNGISWLLVA